jgi:hypothetical protein
MIRTALVRSSLAIAFCTAFLGTSAIAERVAHAEEVEAFARVVTEEAEVRTGPGASYRSIAVVGRGQTLAVDRRASDQFWLKVVLEDGRSGWVLGDEVEVYAVGRSGSTDHASRPGLFAPPPLLGSHGGVALLAGLLGGTYLDANQVSHYAAVDGYFELRPAVVLSPAFAIEPWGGMSRTDDGRLFNVGAWALVHLFPDWAVDPYVGVGGGHLWSHANADSFAVTDDSVNTARVGGGFLFGLRGRILVRVEATDLVLFTVNRTHSVQTYLAGLGAYF